MADLYPLRFEPIYRRYLWGGRRLASVLGKPLPPGDDYAESWEVVDHGGDQSVVRGGPLAGTPLTDLVQGDAARPLLGRHHPQPQFPLLFKFLDAHRDLSVQVHPNDDQASQLDPPDRGKTEAWVVLHADPGSAIYAGLKKGFDREAFEREINRGTTHLCLHRLQPRAGDCLLIPAGTVHALGAGLVVAEIQQASDTTFRLFDWNRVGADGRPRQLHIEQGLDVIDFARGPVSPQPEQAPSDSPCIRLVECDKFVLDRRRFAPDTVQQVGGDDRFHILAVIEGEVCVAGDPLDEPLAKGQTLLLPAVAEAAVRSTAGAVVLDMYLP